jgi:hypothetical protein
MAKDVGTNYKFPEYKSEKIRNFVIRIFAEFVIRSPFFSCHKKI